MDVEVGMACGRKGFVGRVGTRKHHAWYIDVVCGEDYLDASSDVTDDNRNIN
jgi:hypothetical protein